MPKLADTITGARLLGARMAASQRQANPDGRMPLMDHIRELRSRLLKALAAIAVGMGIGFIPRSTTGSGRSWSIRSRLAEHQAGNAHLIVIGVFDPFMLRVQVAFFFGLIITCPFWLYQIWAFIAPGLYRREKRWGYTSRPPRRRCSWPAHNRVLRDEPGPEVPVRAGPERDSGPARRSPTTSTISRR